MNRRNKHIDKTFLSLDQAEKRGFIHRDYIAHCLRWSHVVRHLYHHNLYKRATILDVGCGKEAPLAKLFYTSRLSPEYYIGIDYGEIIPSIRLPTQFRLIGTTDIVQWKPTFQSQVANLVVAFEVLEHIEPRHVVATLRHLHDITSPTCEFFFSTPNWNEQDCAANHVNEMKFDALGAVLIRLGYTPLHIYGTFASQRDYVQLMTPEQQSVFYELAQYYDSNVLSCIFAPLYPQESRNALWHCVKSSNKPVEESDYIFPDLYKVPPPWSSSDLWQQLAES